MNVDFELAQPQPSTTNTALALALAKANTTQSVQSVSIAIPGVKASMKVPGRKLQRLAVNEQNKKLEQVKRKYLDHCKLRQLR